ncbi:MAG: sugar ABC transporter permease [Saccharofermentans sp.]|nr:sugar ABC transporter permease [Saccharofermentans sp.]
MKNKNQINKRYSKWGYIFSIPFVLAFVIFHLVPLGNTILYAFSDVKHVIGYAEPNFLYLKGLPWYKNFLDVFKSSSFKHAIGNTFFFWLAQAIPEWIIAFWIAAVMTDRRMKIKGRKIFKPLFLFPKLLSGTYLGSMLFGNLVTICGTTVGVIYVASLIDGFGITMEDLEFFTSTKFFIIAVSIFMHFGITFVYAVAGITSIPVEIFEAAEMDGANRVQTFFRVTVPCMRPIMLFITVITIVDGLGMTDIPSMFGFDLLDRNFTLQMYIEMQAFSSSSNLDRGAAASLILLCLYLIIAGTVYFCFFRDKDEIRLKKLHRKELMEAKRSM